MKLLFFQMSMKNAIFLIVNFFLKNQTKGRTSLRNISRSDDHLFQEAFEFEVVRSFVHDLLR